MMIDVTVAEGFSGDLAEVYTHMNPLVAGAAMLWHTAGAVVFETADHQRFTVTGSGLQVAMVAGRPQITGGTVDGLSFGQGAQALVSFADLQTTGAALWQAFAAEAAGSDPAALTHLLVQHCWTFHGSNGADQFGWTVRPGFGVLDPTGNDRIFLNGGDDRFFSGTANDTVFGGSGNDTVAGGNDQDSLSGGSGNDVMIGGSGDDLQSGDSGDDRLQGLSGNDSLLGGLGCDILSGCAGNDVLTGGAAADVFVFGAGIGRDVITDYQSGVDHLQALGLAIPLITAEGGNTLVRFGGNEVLLIGVAPESISAADFI